MSLAAVVARLVASLDGAGAVFLQLAAFAVIVIGVAGAVREAARWYAAWDDDARDAASDAVPVAEPVAPAVAASLALATPVSALAAERPGVPPRMHDRLRALVRRHRFIARRRSAPRTAVIALADAGTDRAEIARRTGLSRDAVALAIALRR